MSTDWIKVRCDLRTHPKVVRMASALKADKLRVLGGLFAVWAIFDAHAVDGVLEGYTFEAMDDELRWEGFSAAMTDIGWLVPRIGEGLEAPRFDEHNGQSAKRRAMEAERKRLEREADKEATKSGQMSASDADTKRTREEKRREEEKENTPPLRGSPPAGPTTRGCRLPKDWVPDDVQMAFARAQGIQDPIREADRFRDYWVAQPGQKGVKTDWIATWRNWVRKAAESAPGRRPQAGDDPFAGAL